jgi:hypothetical protein
LFHLFYSNYKTRDKREVRRGRGEGDKKDRGRKGGKKRDERAGI